MRKIYDRVFKENAVQLKNSGNRKKNFKNVD